jgi:methionine-rich copper-binding protein CopC
MDIKTAPRFTDILFNKTAFAAALLLQACLLAPSAWAHAKLVAADPVAQAALAAPPATIRLQFNDNVELPFSKIKVVDVKDAATEALAIKLDAAEPKALIATMPALPSGSYRVIWSTVTRDGHKVKGEYAFSVK